jgi:glycosyltransferase involved in cell wall biosynthesis
VKILRVRAFPRRRDYYFAPDIYRKILDGGWDIVHLQSYHTLVAPLAMLAVRHAGLPFVVTFHGGGHSSALRNQMRSLQLAALRPSLARARRLIALTEFEVNFFSQKLRLPRERFVIIPNGADLPEPAAPAAGAAQGTLIASIGRLERYKGHQRVISALPYILQKRPDARLWIAGTGPYEADLRLLVEKLGLAGRVEIRAVPASQRAQMAAELQRASLVMLLSEYETHPIAILEALSLGRPVVVADNSGMSELARKGWARAIPLKSSPEQVAVAALEQLDRPPAAKFVLPDWDTCAAALLCLYQSCAGSQECAF